LHGEVPLLPRRTGPTEVHFVGGAAGPLGGDRLTIDVEVGDGATLTVRTVAASLALPHRDGGLSRLTVNARVGTDARLNWLPEPLIAGARCHHETLSMVDVAATGTLVWRDELVCGRHGEQPGDARQRTAVTVDGTPLYVNDLAVGPSAPGWAGAGVLGGARVTASILVVGDAAAQVHPHATPTEALMPLAGPGILACGVGDELWQVRQRLEPHLKAVLAF
jgi:urease accessory protein